MSSRSTRSRKGLPTRKECCVDCGEPGGVHTTNTEVLASGHRRRRKRCKLCNGRWNTVEHYADKYEIELEIVERVRRVVRGLEDEGGIFNMAARDHRSRS